MSVIIRPATSQENFTEIAKLYYQVWQTTYRNQLPASFLATLTPKNWQPEKRWRQTFLAMTDNDQPIGVVSYGPARDTELAEQGELYSIYLLAEFQHQGIGACLFQAAVQKLNASYQQKYLWVLDSNRSARQFYLAQGLHETNDQRQVAVPGTTLHEIRYAW